MALSTLAGSSAEEEAFILSEINITPLTDVFLVLLIIFMVTSSAISQLGVDVQLPQAKSTQSSNPSEGVIVTLLANGRIRLDQKEIPITSLKGGLTQAFLKIPSKLVILEGDRSAFLGSAIQVMDEAKKAGAERFAIATTEGREE